MPTFGQIAEELLQLNFKNLVYEFFNLKTTQDWIKINIKKRLFRRGLIKDGRLVETDEGDPYATFTKRKKQLKNQPTNRVTLLDEGDLYRSFTTLAKKHEIQILANFEDHKYGVFGIYKNFKNRFKNEEEFNAFVMELKPEEIEILFDKFLDYINQNKNGR
jgi:hypothetical protein